ncbi:hypothetical protein FJZ31_05260 [Candidatus Poribacteria bacterium]|nr:hypothetical protein [Candidatus Poribacteria bacterium]
MIEPKLLTKLKKLPSQISKSVFAVLLPCAILGWFILLAIGLRAGDVWNAGMMWYSILALPVISAITGIVYAISTTRIKQEFLRKADEILSRFYEQLLQIRDAERDQAERSVTLYRQIARSLNEVSQPEMVKSEMLQAIQNSTGMILEQTQNMQTLEAKIASYSLDEMQSRLRQYPEDSALMKNIENYKNIRAHIENMRETINKVVQSMDKVYLNIIHSPESVNRNIEEVNNCMSALELSSRVYEEVRSLQL